MMLLVAIVLVLLWVFQILFLENFYIGQRVNEVMKRATNIASNISKIDAETLEDRIDELTYSYNASIELISKDRNLLYSNFSGRQPLAPNQSTRADIFSKALEGDVIVSQMKHQRFQIDYVTLALPVFEKDVITSALMINMPLAPVNETADILRKQLFYIVIILVVVSVVVSFGISKTFTKPILSIIKVTKKMAKGDFETKIEEKSNDEIGQLAKSINYLGTELSKIENLRRDIIANVSHDLRTPLSLIRGYAETIKDVTGQNKEKREKQLQIIIDESERLSKIVDDILYLSRIQTGNVSLNITEFDIVKMIKDVLNRYALLANKRKIVLDIDNVNKTNVWADKKRIEQVLYNLLSNAFSHTMENDTINISLENLYNDTKIKVFIADTGEGIGERELSRIWERYYKSDKARNQRTQSTGLGLAIVKSIFEAHNVNYGVESKMSEGTTFWFELDVR